MRIVLLLVLALLLPAQALAEIPHYPDPVYKRLGPDDRLPMDEMMDLAKRGDVRAQYIVADLYAKGKGGVAKNTREAYRWFEESAMHGYPHSFIRLAALAKAAGKTGEAWQWYTLAIRDLDYGDARLTYVKAARDALKLSGDELDAAKKSLRDWQGMRREHLAKGDDAHKETTTPPAPKGEKADEQN